MALILGLLSGGCDGLFSEPSVEYVVERGDTLGRIAKQHGVTVAQLRTWNGISGDLIEVGQVIIIRTEEQTVTVQPTKRRKGAVSGKRSQAAAHPKSGLSMPPKRKCLAGPSLEALSEDEPDFQASAGLSLEQIRGPFSAFLPKLGRCFENGWPTATVDFEITAGCDGRVSRVAVLDGDGVESAVLECMRSTLMYVGLPAHDMPDGMTFRYPVSLGS